MRRRYKRKPIQKKTQGNEQFLRPTVQTKLNMGKPGDKYEVEADKMADQVVNNKSGESAVQKKEGEEEVQQKPLAASITPLIQKMEASEDENAQAKLQRKEDEESVQAKEEEEVQKQEEEEAVQAKEEEEVQAKCDGCEKESVQKKEEEEVQTKLNAQPQKNQTIESKLKNGNGGRRMDSETKTNMEQGFGADFSDVNIHTGSEAEKMSQDMGAQAFTHGNDIYFNKGKYNPKSKEGKHLLAHELTHTIQQGGGKMIQQSFDSTISIQHRFLRSRRFNVSNGNVTVTCDGAWDRGPANCGSGGDYSMVLKELGTVWDSSHGEKRFTIGASDTQTWSDLPNGTYYLDIHVSSTNPTCILMGDINVRT